MRTRLPVALGTLALLAGCGSGSQQAARSSEPAAARETGATPKAHAAAPSARERRMKSVVRAWSRRLNADDNRGVARLFRLPAVVEQGPYGFRLKTREQLTIWHANLPCAGRVISITVSGRFATAVFELGNRTTSKCDAPGTRAAARFEIVDGKIVAWVQVPVPEEAAGGGGLSA